MAEDFDDKTEAPTQRRREEAREQGQVARSPDLSAAVLLLAFILLLKAFGGGLMDALRALVLHLFSGDSFRDLGVASLGSGLVPPLLGVVAALAPLLAGATLVAIAVNLAQVGFHLTAARLKPNLGALDPIKGLGRLFKIEGLAHLVMNLLKLALCGALGWSVAVGRLDQVVASQDRDVLPAFALACTIVYKVALYIALLLLVLAVIDYGFQRWRHERQLRMSKREIKEELRRMEGDPKVKQRRRQIALQMAIRSLRKNVPTADVVVTNPTHFAVALKYDQATMSAPRVVAKGADLAARRIRELAVTHGVPVVERPPLARELYRLCKVGQEIPESLYSAVAEILAYVYEITGKLQRNHPQLATSN